jgi:hypothetical protein
LDFLDLSLKLGQVGDQRIGFSAGIGAIGPKERSFDSVKAMERIWPSVDLLIEFRNEAAGKDFRTLPADPGVNPGPLGAIKVVGFYPLTQRPHARQRLPNVFDQVVPILFGTFVKRSGTRGQR